MPIRTLHDPLNTQAIAAEEAEAEIRLLIKTEYFKRTAPKEIGRKVDDIIRKALKDIKIPALKDAVKRSLRNFAQRQYNEYKRSFGFQLVTLLAVISLTDTTATEAVKTQARRTLTGLGYSTANLYGVPLKKFSVNYFKENVTPALDRLAKQFPLDPDDITGRNSLRNRAEMEVRYQGHTDNIEDLRTAGHKLVIASTHADCSERCRPWQGRVYSLDGTSGTTDDGRRYVPLEEATDVWYTTKVGKRYKNGLLGFNCRHYLIPYEKGYRFPKPNVAEERKQYAITQEQRAYEREVRKWRTKALTAKNIDREKYLEARRKAIEWNKRYIDFSIKNDRAYYPSRTKII